MKQGIAILALLGVAACGGSSKPPPPSPDPPSGVETITGRERIGWAQPANDASELASFDYAIYVDGTRRVLEGDTCSTSGSPFECSAPLPPLTPGRHSLELVAFVTSQGDTVESGRSATIQVNVVAVVPPADVAALQASPIVTTDGHRFETAIVAAGLDDPADLAIAPDGRVFVAERAGRVRIVGSDGPNEPAALELDDVAASGESGLTSIALHPQFDQNGHVYVAYAAQDTGAVNELTFRIARFREHAGVLAQGAVVAQERVAAASARVVARFGSDGRLYAGFSAGEDPRDAQAPGTVLGKILRLNEDGSTPRDNPAASATFSSGHRDPRGLVWHPTTGAMLELERNGEAGDELNSITGGADYGWPIANGSARHGRSVSPDLLLPAGTEVSGASFVPFASKSALAGELLVAARGTRDLLRIRVAGSGWRAEIIEGMLQRRFGRLAAVAVSRDGLIYIATANRETSGAGADMLIRLAPLPFDRRR